MENIQNEINDYLSSPNDIVEQIATKKNRIRIKRKISKWI